MNITPFITNGRIMVIVSAADLKQEIYYTLPSRSTEVMMTYGSHDNNCTDGYGGHQAIVFDLATRQPRIVGTKYIGCHFCRLVCPTGAMGAGRRICCSRKSRHRVNFYQG